MRLRARRIGSIHPSFLCSFVRAFQIAVAEKISNYDECARLTPPLPGSPHSSFHIFARTLGRWYRKIVGAPAFYPARGRTTSCPKPESGYSTVRGRIGGSIRWRMAYSRVAGMVKERNGARDAVAMQCKAFRGSYCVFGVRITISTRRLIACCSFVPVPGAIRRASPNPRV